MKNIVIEKLCKRYDKLEVLKDVSLNVNYGEVVSIIGPSGSGKSTLLRTIQGLEEIHGGVIKIDKENLKGNTHLYKKIGMVFQNFNLFPHMTVLENIIEAPVTVNKMEKEEATKMAEELLKKVGLEDKKDSYPSQISGGQKQRVAIARTLAMEPEILLFDEPTSALDPELVGEVLNVIRDLTKEKMTMLIVTHEMNFAKEVSDYIVFMDEGLIIEKAKPNDIFERPKHQRVKSFIEKMI